MTDEDRRYWVGRCLKLEAEIARLKGYADAPARNVPGRHSVELHKPSLAWPHRVMRYVTPDEIETMRELRRRGLGYNEIARRTPFAPNTVRRYTMDVLEEV